MRHFGKIGKSHITGNIPAKGNSKLGLRIVKFIRIDDFTHGDNINDLIRHLNADSGLIRDWRLNAHARSRKIQRDIIRKACNTADFYTGGRLKFVTGHSRAAADIDDTSLDTKAFQRINKTLRICFQLRACIHIRTRLRSAQ